MKSRRLSACLCGLFAGVGVCSICASPGHGQLCLLNGTVTDAGGRTVAKATITVRSLDTNQTFTAVSDDAGFYAVPSLPPGATNSL